MQGKYNESLSQLDAEPPAKFRESNFEVRRKLTKALSLANTQRPKEAAALISQAETLAETRQPELMGEVALRKGTVCFLADDLGCAEISYRNALQGARKQNDPYFEAAALSGLGIVETRLERYDEAVESYRTALQVAQSAGARYSLEQILGNTAWCYRKLGDYENALILYKQAEEVSRQAHLTDEQVYWIAAISNAYYEQGNLPEAKNYLQRGLSMARERDDKTILVQYLKALAGIALDTDELEEAEKYFDEASTYAGDRGDAAVALDLAIVDATIKQKKRQFADAEKTFLQIVSDARSDSSQKWGAQASLAALYVEEHADAKAEKQYRTLLATVEDVRSSVKDEELRLPFTSAVIALYGEYIDFLVMHRRESQALEVAELSRARTLAEGLKKVEAGPLTPANFRPQQLAQKLHSILLFYWIGSEHSYLWVITPSKLACLSLPKKFDIEPLLQSYRGALVNGEDVLTTGNASGKKLYETLIAPARALIPNNSRVVVLPAESLYSLNFETLIVPNPNPHYWIEDVTLSTAGSLTLLAESSRKPSVGTKNLLLVGNSEPPNKDFPALPQAELEMQKVSAHFAQDQRKVLDGKQATPSAYLQSNPRQFSYLHFVTHGTASLTQPLQSAVILSREGDSYKLYARDIVQHPLNAQLVTISACNGAGTRAYAGEGLVGLSWAFLRAGAHNVIASLWEVSDSSSTGLLMDKLYEGLGKGEDASTALRNAKLFILKSNPATVFRKPFYWAPFQLYVGS